MYEVVVTLCLAGSTLCRDVLLPGYEAAAVDVCEAHLSRTPPDLRGLAGFDHHGNPHCAPQGRTLDFAEVAPSVFVHRGRIEEPSVENGGDVANIGFVIGNTSVAVIDSGSARWIGESVWRAIRARTNLPVSHVILTHVHPDHVLGAAVLAESGAEVVAHAGLERALADRRANYLESFSGLVGPAQFLGTQTVRVDRPVTDKTEIDLGGRSIALIPWPRAHTGTDLTVQDLRSGVLFAGDLVFDRHTPALDGSLVGWQEVLVALSGMNATQAVPGHGGPMLDWPAGAEPLQRYLEVLAEDTRAAIAAGIRLGNAVTTIAQSEAAHWELFGAYNARNATVAYTELEWE